MPSPPTSWRASRWVRCATTWRSSCSPGCPRARWCARPSDGSAAAMGADTKELVPPTPLVRGGAAARRQGSGGLAAAPAYDLERVRADFPHLAQTMNGRPLVYLDNASSTQKPRAVGEAITTCYRECYANVGRGVHQLAQRATAARERARETVRAFLGA